MASPGKVRDRAKALVGFIGRRVAWRYGNAAEPFKGDPDAAACELNALRAFVDANRSLEYEVKRIGAVAAPGRFRWTGAQAHGGLVRCIPNGSSSVLRFDESGDWGRDDFISFHSHDPFQWTGGCLHEGRLFGFPRASNQLLMQDLMEGDVAICDLGTNYEGEHHYGGVVTADGVVVQPPRNTDHLLMIHLDDRETRTIHLAPPALSLRLRYCASFLHPNGLVYFAPERDEKVVVFDPKTHRFRRIGSPVRAMVFDLALAMDGNLYGFSAAEPGILRIDVREEEATMIRTDWGVPGCYTSKLGINGRIYGIPGRGDSFLEFDVESHGIKVIGHADDAKVVHCAGGCVTESGVIACAPCEGAGLYLLEPTAPRMIPERLRRSCFVDCY